MGVYAMGNLPPAVFFADVVADVFTPAVSPC